jgi:hypothetical protein
MVGNNSKMSFDINKHEGCHEKINEDIQDINEDIQDAKQVKTKN